MQEHRTRFLCGCFGKRPRTPERSPGRAGEKTTADTAGQYVSPTSDPDCARLIMESRLEGRVLSSDVNGDSSLAKNHVSISSSAKLTEPDKSDKPEEPSGTDSLSAAFDRACSSLGEEQLKALKNTQGLRELFDQLNTSNNKSKEESPFRRGAQKLGPLLTFLGGSIRLATPLASLDPIASNAFGIIQSVMTVRGSPRKLCELRLINFALDCCGNLRRGRKVPGKYRSNAPKDSHHRKM